MSTKLIAITGGIGCGKSTVCRILKIMGYPIYDCDSEARSIMDNNQELLDSLAITIGESPFKPDPLTGLRKVNRPLLAEIVFNDSEKLAHLNRIVHQAVRDDISLRASLHEARQQPILFVETAILMESKLYNLVDAVWDVYAPLDIRLERAMRRDGAPRHAIEARIRHQQPVPRPFIVSDSGKEIPVCVICNDGHKSLLTQISHLLQLENKK